MTYRLLGPALDDLEVIDGWVASNFGEAAAIRARHKLSETFVLLATFQQMGIERSDITSRPVRFFSSSPNWIVYEPGDPLLIHRVFPAALDIHTLKLP
jgi:plasmid stabilization system protein ParE